MRRNAPRVLRGRARDFLLTGLGGACFALAGVFVVGRIWFHGLFAAALQGEPLVWAACFAGVAVVLGILHTFSPPHLPPDERQAYKDQD